MVKQIDKNEELVFVVIAAFATRSAALPSVLVWMFSALPSTSTAA